MNTPPLRIHTVSLGCPKNLVDTERLLGAFGGAGLPGMVPADTPEEADMVLVNTCGFIQPAVEEAVSVILSMAEALRGLEPKPLLAVAGCLVSRYGKKDLSAGIPEVDLWLDTTQIGEWPALAAQALGLSEPAAAPAANIPGPLPPRRLSTGPGFAYLKVSEGCSRRCRFCTIPSIRGPHVSRPLDDLVAEAARLLDQGVRELVLVGQDLTAYGQDLGMKDGFVRLLDRLLPLNGLKWLRPMYLYPAGLTPATLSFMAKAGRPLLPYFDVPLQHSHPDVLKAMGRPFNQDPAEVLARIRTHFPDAAIRTSLIVGYPGETPAMFLHLLGFVETANFHHLGVFPYHPEGGTPAAKLPKQVGERTKRKRRDEIMALQAEISAEILEQYVGQRMEVLVEAAHPEWPGLFTGRAWFQAPEVDGVTYVSGEQVSPGRMVMADVEEAKVYDLVALA
jgi:ribosomal protein S12 methylthiotransferase RimO